MADNNGCYSIAENDQKGQGNDRVDNKIEEEVKSLKRKIEHQDDSAEQIKHQHKIEVEALRNQMADQKHLIEQLKGKIECPVCMEIPRSGPVPVCPNGHFVCKKCKTLNCPTCRTRIGDGKSYLAQMILENIEHKCRFVECQLLFPLGNLDHHEKVCPHRVVSCPAADCTTRVSLSQLVDHLTDAARDCCLDKTPTHLNTTRYIRRNFSVDVALTEKDMNWQVRIYKTFGETFGFFPLKSQGIYYIMVVMFASEEVCSNYDIQVIVHEHESEVFDSKLSLKFNGNPASIDDKGEEQKLYAISETFMGKLLKKSSTGSSFSISLLISIS